MKKTTSMPMCLSMVIVALLLSMPIPECHAFSVIPSWRLRPSPPQLATTTARHMSSTAPHVGATAVTTITSPQEYHDFLNQDDRLCVIKYVLYTHHSSSFCVVDSLSMHSVIIYRAAPPLLVRIGAKTNQKEPDTDRNTLLSLYSHRSLFLFLLVAMLVHSHTHTYKHTPCDTDFMPLGASHAKSLELNSRHLHMPPLHPTLPLKTILLLLLLLQQTVYALLRLNSLPMLNCADPSVSNDCQVSTLANNRSV